MISNCIKKVSGKFQESITVALITKCLSFVPYFHSFRKIGQVSIIFCLSMIKDITWGNIDITVNILRANKRNIKEKFAYNLTYLVTSIFSYQIEIEFSFDVYFLWTTHVSRYIIYKINIMSVYCLHFSNPACLWDFCKINYIGLKGVLCCQHIVREIETEFYTTAGCGDCGIYLSQSFILCLKYQWLVFTTFDMAYSPRFVHYWENIGGKHKKYWKTVSRPTSGSSK